MSVDTETKKGEVIAVPFVCGETGLPFRAIFRRGVSSFKLSAVERISPFPNDPQQKCDDAIEIDMSEIETIDLECPWCQADRRTGSIWRCGRCHALSCPSCVSETDRGDKKFSCQSCGCDVVLADRPKGEISKVTVGNNPIAGSVGGSSVRLLTHQGS